MTPERRLELFTRMQAAVDALPPEATPETLSARGWASRRDGDLYVISRPGMLLTSRIGWQDAANRLRRAVQRAEARL